MCVSAGAASLPGDRVHRPLEGGEVPQRHHQGDLEEDRADTKPFCSFIHLHFSIWRGFDYSVFVVSLWGFLSLQLDFFPSFNLAGLGEFKLRDMNDEINKLLREKGHWEDRIKEMGGADYKVLLHFIFLFLSNACTPTWHWASTETTNISYRMQKTGPKMLEREGQEAPGNRGYKYFGACKDLPGIRELFEQARILRLFTLSFFIFLQIF